MNKVRSVLFSAGVLLALGFTLSCSSDDGGNGDDDGSPVTGGADGGGNQFSQIYKDGTLYNASGVIEATDGMGGSGCSNENCGGPEWDHIRVGSVANGKVSLELDKAVLADEYLRDFLDEDEQRSCTSYPENIKKAGGMFVLTNNGNYIGSLIIYYEDDQIREAIDYEYFSKTGKIACNLQYEHSKEIANINAKEGWNKIYFHAYRKDGIMIREWSTKNILTKEKEMKWILER